MSKNMQNLVLFMESSIEAPNISLKSGNLCLNGFCIDEDSAFELSGVHYLKKTSYGIIYEEEFELERKSKGNGYLSLQSTVSVCLIFFIRVKHSEFP